MQQSSTRKHEGSLGFCNSNAASAHVLQARLRLAARRTWRGLLDDAFGYSMSAYCVWRMYKACRTLLLSETRGDAASGVVHLFVSQRDFAVDVKVLGQYVSLLLIGWLIYSSLRNFSRAVALLVFAARGGVSPTQLVLFSTEIMGLYFLSRRVDSVSRLDASAPPPRLRRRGSECLTGRAGLLNFPRSSSRSVLLIRPKLPVKHQIVMTKALGGEHSNRFYEVRLWEAVGRHNANSKLVESFVGAVPHRMCSSGSVHPPLKAEGSYPPGWCRTSSMRSSSLAPLSASPTSTRNTGALSARSCVPTTPPCNHLAAAALYPVAGEISAVSRYLSVWRRQHAAEEALLRGRAGSALARTGSDSLHKGLSGSVAESGEKGGLGSGALGGLGIGVGAGGGDAFSITVGIDLHSGKLK